MILILFRLELFLHIMDQISTSIMENYFSEHAHNLVLYQPKLGLYAFRPKILGVYGITDSYLWTKCVKTSIYQKVVKKVGE